MKKILFATVASFALVGPLALTSASAQDWQDRRGQQSQQDQYRGSTDEDQDRRGDWRDRRDARQAWREDRRDARWDERQHNGYYYNNRWYYGPPSSDYYGRSGFSLGYRPWANGQRLGYYNGRYTVVDYRRLNLRQPPRGHHWVRDDRGHYLLASIAGGRVIQVLFNGSDNRDRRRAWRDDRRDTRWDDRQHNGYYYDNRWNYGPPPADRYDRVTLGYQPWTRGQRLGYYQQRYSEVDYRAYDLRQPPRGYHWVRDDRGDYLLAAIVSGVIAQVIINSGR